MTMKKLTIEIDTDANAFDVSDEQGRHTDLLAFDEMLGQVVSLCHPSLGEPLYAMRTPQEWIQWRERLGRRTSEHDA